MPRLINRSTGQNPPDGAGPLVDPQLALESTQEQERARADLDRGIITLVPDPALNLPS